MKFPPKIQNNFIILTGGPGSGKTSIIEFLKKQGYPCVKEVGRQIIREQLAIGGNALHWGDKLKFQDLMLSRSIDDYLRNEEKNDLVFFDRGIPELIGYSYLINQPVRAEYKEAAASFRYYQTVFIAPPWKEIYQNDAERKQDFEEAIETYYVTQRAYQECGYSMIELPKTHIAQRANFILESLKKIREP